MRRIITLLCTALIVSFTDAQINVLKINSGNISEGTYLLSNVPSYCRPALSATTSHLSISTDHVNNESQYSLLLNYSGSWEAYLLHSTQYTSGESVNISAYDNLRLVFYSTTQLTGTQIPSVLLAYTDGAENLLWDGKQKAISDYVNPIPAGQWITINVPISNIGASHLTSNQGVIICCTAWSATGDAGILYIDKVELTSSNPTLLPISLDNGNKPFYANGFLYLNGYSGNISLINMLGKSVYNSKSVSEIIPINLPSGIYLLKTDKVVTKIIVP